ncbi:myosin heavy chain, striated muscle [Folsomia candida]|uniref:Uncharacterized protein n=1 Tax=Folsomia candida TaxID=158441 RepID=A0A226DXK5_FOLCA|nr:myosin heavy chain, striated muscle [Folsomia candida]OXA50192.1 hypothetical protein Fcan01_14845 [Folsomia candida]
MSYLRQNKSTCGRYPNRPKSSNAEEAFVDNEEDLPLQTQIDNLRAKISLKQRYNKALLEEVTESHKGAHQMIEDLRNENELLHRDRNEAIASGTSASVKALRNHRYFMLALRGKNPAQVYEWLDDQISDQRKKLDEKLHTVTSIKLKLSDAEHMVVELEDWPFPGSTPWEQQAIQEFTKLGVAIAQRGDLKDCVSTLNIKFKEILNQLRGERDTWPYVVIKLEKSYRELRKELDDLQNMLDDAKRLKKTTYYRLMMTEKEYTENRRIRHHRIVKIRKMCELELKRNRKRFDKAATQETRSPIDLRSNKSKALLVSSAQEIDYGTLQELKEKRAAVAQFEDKARVLVEAMRVKDLRFCPKRIHTVFKLRHILQDELSQRQIALTALVKQKSNFLLIKNHLFYTGCVKLEEFDKESEERETKLLEAQRQTSDNDKGINKIGKNAVLFHSALIGLLDLLQEGKRTNVVLPSNYLDLAKLALDKVKVLITSVVKLRSLFNPDEEPQRNYGSYVKIPVSRYSCRLGAQYSTGSDEEMSDDDDTGIQSTFGNDRVLSREEIKSKSDKVYAQGMLRQGFRASAERKQEKKHGRRKGH